jgi:hypothetical protein
MKIHVEGKTEFEKFDNFMRRLAAVPHSELKAKMDAYEKAKQRRKRKKLKSSASVRASKSLP